MKVEIEKVKVKFTPVKVTITFESQDEIDIFKMQHDEYDLTTNVDHEIRIALI